VLLAGRRHRLGLAFTDRFGSDESQDPDEVRDLFQQLQGLLPTSEELAASGVGKMVNRLRKACQVSALELRLELVHLQLQRPCLARRRARRPRWAKRW
jgi:hypothetical protein